MKGFLPVLLLCSLLVFPGTASVASVHPTFSDTAGHPAERDIQLVGNPCHGDGVIGTADC